MAAAGSRGDNSSGGGGGAWFELSGCCIHCNKDDYSCEYGPRSLLLCSCCGSKGTHVECYEQAKGVTLTQEFIESGSNWFCSQVCLIVCCVGCGCCDCV